MSESWFGVLGLRPGPLNDANGLLAPRYPEPPIFRPFSPILGPLDPLNDQKCVIFLHWNEIIHKPGSGMYVPYSDH